MHSKDSPHAKASLEGMANDIEPNYIKSAQAAGNPSSPPRFQAIAVSLHPASALMSSIHSHSAWCCRRHELHNAVDNPSQAEKLRAKHIKILRGCISQYLGSAQKALGPTVLQVRGFLHA